MRPCIISVNRKQTRKPIYGLGVLLPLTMPKIIEMNRIRDLMSGSPIFLPRVSVKCAAESTIVSLYESPNAVRLVLTVA